MSEIPKKPVRKTNGKRNRAAGHAWELYIINTLKKRNLYPHAVSTRSESRTLDGFGIDVMNHDEGINGRMNDSIQAKSESRTVAYPKLLDRIREAGRANPVVFHRQTSKSGTRFMARDTFAICYMDSYLDMMAARELVIRLKSCLDTLPVEVRQRIETEMKLLNL